MHNNCRLSAKLFAALTIFRSYRALREIEAIWMIREYRETDVGQVLDIWLSASIKAHSFVDPEFWKSKLDDMRNVYIPASETFVFECKDGISGFYCLFDDTLAAIFVSPDKQGKGIGAALIIDAKRRRQSMRLTVYKENVPSVTFYEKQGFIAVEEKVDEDTGQPELVMEYHS